MFLPKIEQPIYEPQKIVYKLQYMHGHRKHPQTLPPRYFAYTYNSTICRYIRTTMKLKLSSKIDTDYSYMVQYYSL
jgi:hypothetical protein